MKFEHTSGGFTLPGESGQEKLTLELAKKWGADVIRDSDGTQLSDEILDAGYDIYSTICIIRDHNAWAKEHPECLQQSFLSTEPVIAAEEPLTVKLMAGFFDEQFKINDRSEALRYWQVWDRTANKLLPADTWQWDAAAGTVTVASPVPFHAYTVSFLAWRTWEEINMYNHVTNSWTSEHLLPVDPRTKEAQDFLYDWLKNWCETHPQTNVVRFTSMFYNFVWIWGSDKRNQNLFTDWGSYDFTVSEKALDDFAAQYGYALTAEDFINKGSLQVTHMPPTAHKRDYMEFTQRFVAGYGKKLVDLVHSYGKRAYVFYDDSWVGVEPYGPHFKEFGFDGVIKCVFSGYEARMCAGVDAPVHELRFHPYLFPVGLGGAPTFAPGGNPTRDAAEYWNHVRRALLRAKIDRIGLGGYLHLLNDFPDFVEYIADISDEFRAIKELHTHGAVATLPLTVAVLHSWGNLRPWTLSGHFHETYMHTLIHINEALAGLPVNVKFINFDDVKNGVGNALYNAAGAVLRSTGDSRTPLAAMVVSSLCNIVLDLWFILGLHMGVAGAALATVAAQFLSAGVCLCELWRQKQPFAFASVRLCFNKVDAALILRFGLPTALQSCMITLGGMTVQGIVNSFGSVTMAAYTAVQRIDSLTIQVVVSVSNALAIYTGQNMGKHDIDRVCQGLRDSLKALCVICLVLAVAVFASRRLLLSIFLDPATDAASIAQGADFLSVMGFAYIIAAVMNSYLNVLRGAGDVNVSLVAGLFEMGARLAFTSLLAPHLGVWGIWLATPLSWASGCIIPVVRYYSKEWMKRTLI